MSMQLARSLLEHNSFKKWPFTQKKFPNLNLARFYSGCFLLDTAKKARQIPVKIQSKPVKIIISILLVVFILDKLKKSAPNSNLEKIFSSNSYKSYAVVPRGHESRELQLLSLHTLSLNCVTQAKRERAKKREKKWSHINVPVPKYSAQTSEDV